MKKGLFQTLLLCKFKKESVHFKPCILEELNSVNGGQGNIVFDIDEREGLIVNNENFYASKQIIIIVILQK